MKRQFGIVMACAALTGALAACGSEAPDTEAAAAQDNAVPEFADASDIGPKVGTALPDIPVRSEDGATTALSSLSGHKGSVLFFVRSADWCPYCKKQLKDLAALAPALTERGYATAAISYDAPATLKSYAEAQGITYPLLSDEGSKLIDALGLRDPQYPDGFAAGVPYPTILVVDPDGTIVARTVARNFRIRPDDEQILKLLDTVPAA